MIKRFRIRVKERSRKICHLMLLKNPSTTGKRIITAFNEQEEKGMKTSIDVVAIGGRTVEVLTDYIQAYIDRQWQLVWVQNLNEIANIYEKGGDVAYGVYISKLFRSVTRELYETSLNPKPVLPGNFRQSEERWGSWEERERRFWSVIQQENDTPLG